MLKAKTAQAGEITSLKKRVKKLERRNKTRTSRLKRLRNVGVLDDDEVVAEKEVSTANPVTTAGEVVTTADVESRRKEEKSTNQSLKEEANMYIFEKYGWFHSQSIDEQKFDEVQKAFDKTMSWIDSFVSIDFEAVKEVIEGSSKRAGDQLEQEDAKRQRIEEENTFAELKRCLEIVPDDEDDVTVEATPLSLKYLTIIYYKSTKKGGKSFCKSSKQMAILRCILLLVKCSRNLTREDLEEEDDASLRCSSSTLFSTRVKTKISKRKKTSVIHDEGDDTKKSLVTRGRKGKEKVIKDDGICRKGNKADVSIYKRAMVNGKAKMVEDVGVVKRGKERGVIIEDGGFSNGGGKETMVTKRAIGSRKIEGKSVKVESE
nr:hypothetical protein [Tanacetum cinerariifolium]